MLVAICQYHIRWEDKEANYAKAVSFVKCAAENRADVVLFPEMSLTGFSMNILHTGEISGDTLKRISELAKENRICIGIGWVNLNGNKGENHYTIIGNDGKVLSDYIKIHPFSFAKEDSYFISGTKLNYFELCGMECSNFICYDLRFPEIFQAVSNKAKLIIVPANWPQRRSEHWKCLLRARAIENQVYIVGINCVGIVGDLEYSGDSCVINPQGDILCSLSDKEGILYQEIVDDVQQYRDSFKVKADRKTDWYRMVL